MKHTVAEAAGMITKIGAAVAVLTGFLTWAWTAHNQFLMDALSPLLRSSYVNRINNYRRIDCMTGLTFEQKEAMADLLLDYEELVGRPIADRDCDSL